MQHLFGCEFCLGFCGSYKFVLFVVKMAYVGVEFTENGSVGLVHCSWLTPLKQEVFWPPYKTTNLFNKALANAEAPNQATWKLFNIKRSFFECGVYLKYLFLYRHDNMHVLQILMIMNYSSKNFFFLFFEQVLFWATITIYDYFIAFILLIFFVVI